MWKRFIWIVPPAHPQINVQEYYLHVRSISSDSTDENISTVLYNIPSHILQVIHKFVTAGDPAMFFYFLNTILNKTRGPVFVPVKLIQNILRSSVNVFCVRLRFKSLS